MKSLITHNIKHRKKANDEFYTPKELVKEVLSITPFNKNDSLLDSAYGTGNFYKEFTNKKKYYTKSFFTINKMYDWIITNPPYSKLDDWIEHTCKLSIKGFGLLLGLHNITPKRIEMIENAGFGITTIKLYKVFKWFGITSYIICESNKKSIIKYNRKVWY